MSNKEYYKIFKPGNVVKIVDKTDYYSEEERKILFVESSTDEDGDFINVNLLYNDPLGGYVGFEPKDIVVVKHADNSHLLKIVKEFSNIYKIIKEPKSSHIYFYLAGWQVFQKEKWYLHFMNYLYELGKINKKETLDDLNENLSFDEGLGILIDLLEE